MEPGVIIALITAAGALVVGVFQLLGGRSSASMTSQGKFAENLMARIGQLDARVKELEGHEQARDDRIAQLTAWGTYSNDPIPRTPPPWSRTP